MNIDEDSFFYGGQMNNKIDFMGIGAARSGSTWLWSVLNHHPDIWMPPIKELHYFDRSIDYPSPSILADDKLVFRLFGKKIHNSAFRVLFIRSIGKSILLPKKWGELQWKLRYFLGTYNDSWYFSLFENNKKAIKGEITPAYSILRKDDVSRIKALIPDLKVIYIIRNPFDRAWSAIRYRWSRGTLNIENLDEVIQKIEDPSQSNRSDYFQTIQNWSSSFSNDQFQIYFFDEIVHQPKQLIEKIFTYLNLEPSLQIPIESLSVKVNASKERQIPDSVKHYLALKYFHEVEKLIPIVGGYSQDWLKKIKANL